MHTQKKALREVLSGNRVHVPFKTRRVKNPEFYSLKDKKAPEALWIKATGAWSFEMKCCVISLFSVAQNIFNHIQWHVLLSKIPAE